MVEGCVLCHTHTMTHTHTADYMYLRVSTILTGLTKPRVHILADFLP